MRKDFRSGVVEAVPVCLVYAPVGLAFGVLAARAGLSPGATGLMSLLVYAGSAQFIAVGLLQAGSGFGPIVLTTFLVNLRHALMSAALSLRLKKLSLQEQAIFCFELTDETFALHSTAQDPDHDHFPHLLGVNLTSQLCWIVSTISGCLLGTALPQVLLRRFGLDYAMAAMFIALLALYLTDLRRILLAALAAALIVLCQLVHPSGWNPIAVTLVVATLGTVIHR